MFFVFPSIYVLTNMLFMSNFLSVYIGKPSVSEGIDGQRTCKESVASFQSFYALGTPKTEHISVAYRHNRL